MTIKERAQAAVKSAFGKYGLKADELTKISERIAGGLTDETTDEDLNAAVDRADFFVSMMQSVGNRKQVEIENKYKGWQPPKDDHTPPTPPIPPKDDTTPPQGMTKEEIMKLIQDTVGASVTAGIAPLIQQQEQARLHTLLSNNEKLKGIPASFLARYNLDKEENLDSTIDTITADYKTLKTEMFANGDITPAPITPTPQDEDAEFKSMMAKINAQAEPTK